MPKLQTKKPGSPELTCSWLYWSTAELQGGNLLEVASKPFIFLRVASSSITLLWPAIIFSSQTFSTFLFSSTCSSQSSLRAGMVQMMMKYSATDRRQGRFYNQHRRINQIYWCQHSFIHVIICTLISNASVHIRDACLPQSGCFFGKSPNGLWPPLPIFRNFLALFPEKL